MRFRACNASTGKLRRGGILGQIMLLLATRVYSTEPSHAGA